MVLASGSDNNVSLRHSPGHYPEGNLEYIYMPHKIPTFFATKKRWSSSKVLDQLRESPAAADSPSTRTLALCTELNVIRGPPVLLLLSELSRFFISFMMSCGVFPLSMRSSINCSWGKYR